MAAFSDEEIAAALEKHPGLVRISPGEVEGDLPIHATYNGVTINDVFKVRITQANPGAGRVPVLYEIDGRSVAAAKKWNKKDLADVHRYPDGSACVCVKQEEDEKFPPGSNLLFFLDNLARDYLYGLASFEQTGIWPWGERSHGTLGLVEFYADHTGPQSTKAIEDVIALIRKDAHWTRYCRQLRKPNGDKNCLCGEKRPIRQCHPDAWRGVLQLHKEMQRLVLRVRSAFGRASNARPKQA